MRFSAAIALAALVTSAAASCPYAQRSSDVSTGCPYAKRAVEATHHESPKRVRRGPVKNKKGVFFSE